MHQFSRQSIMNIEINEAYGTVGIALTLITTNFDFNIENNCVKLSVGLKPFKCVIGSWDCSISA